ncbi:hypothetical protein EVA_06148 [gut metagenome]|uniref:Uncharacterized protein n=1 Tax=gut metagenome TaxID=749906 RepID=J9GSU1_9ZZZZ
MIFPHLDFPDRSFNPAIFTKQRIPIFNRQLYLWNRFSTSLHFINKIGGFILGK